MFLQAGRKITAAFGQSRRQIGIAVAIVIADHIAVMHAEDDPDSTFAVAIIIVLVRVLVVPLAIALCLGERGECQQEQTADRKEKYTFQHGPASGSKFSCY